MRSEIPVEVLGYSAPESRSSLGRVVTAFAWAFCALAGVAIYENVVGDDSAVHAQAESVARSRAGCGADCKVVSVQTRRTVLDYRADYALDGTGTVQVVCRRQALVLGEHHCTPR
jgi:hypothetical protein